MKTIRQTFYFLYASLFLLISCSKDTNNKLEVGNANVTINGKSYSMKTGEITYEKKQDTLNFSIEMYTSDSNRIVTISFLNVFKASNNIYKAGVSKEALDTTLNINLSDTVINIDFIEKGVELFYGEKSKTDTSFYWCDGLLHFGTVNITYISEYNIECSFDFEAMSLSDSTKTSKVKGTLSASFLGGGDPNKIKDVPIHRGTMVVDLDGSPIELKAQAGTVALGSVKKTIIQGNLSSTGQSVVLECVNFTPKINGVYKIGEKINNNGYFTASYAKDKKNIFIADGLNESSGTLKILKITPTSIQGTFEFTGYNMSDPTKPNPVKNGFFYATKIKF